MSTTKRVIFELKKITPKERSFVLNFFETRTGNKAIDQRNYMFDIDVYHYKNAPRLTKLFDLMYPLNDEEIKKLAKEFNV